MQARNQALRKDKSQRVYLADVEDRIRVAYDPAAAHDLVSGDIELCQTGMSALDFVGISGESIPGGCVGSATVVTGVELDQGRPAVLPVPEAHTMDTLPKRTMLLSGKRCYDNKYTVIICGETEQCQMWLPREPDGSRVMVPLEFGAADRVLQLASAPQAVVPGIVKPGDWDAPTMGISQRKTDAQVLCLDDLHTNNIFMALEGEKKKKTAGKAKASVPEAADASVPGASQSVSAGGTGGSAAEEARPRAFPEAGRPTGPRFGRECRLKCQFRRRRCLCPRRLPLLRRCRAVPVTFRQRVSWCQLRWMSSFSRSVKIRRRFWRHAPSAV